MKQLVHNLRTGEAEVLEVPAPRPQAHEILVRNRASLISAGTELIILEFSRQGLLGKARLRPDLVRQFIDKTRKEGVLSAIGAAGSRLERPLSLGYSSAGEVLAVGSAVSEFRVGDRVACGGGGFAVHAEAVRIPRTLAARIHESDELSGRREISFEEAAFSTIGSVALHGLRLGSVQLGEQVAVIGLGLIGLLAVQLARAAGCRVIGMDPDSTRCELARALGCEQAACTPAELEIVSAEMSRGAGSDLIVITAATESNEPIETAARIARDRACVVSIGATGMEIPRKLFYEKELDFRIARAYGPGRYDTDHEELGRDYPPGYVRWTEGRNLGAFLDLLSQNKVQVEPLISHRFPITAAAQAYDVLSSQYRALGIVIEYRGEHELSTAPVAAIPVSGEPRLESTVRVGLLGAGNFVTSTLLGAMKNAAGTEMIAVCAASGSSAAHVAKRGGFQLSVTDPEMVIADSRVNALVIATRHHLHAAQVIAAFKARKHVFCEKPLCLNDDELQQILIAYEDANQESARLLMVGFNRRFAPLAIELKRFLSNTSEPLVMNYRVNAGYLAPSNWLQNPEQGGGRIIGEACHFIDLMTFLNGSDPVQVFATATPDQSRYRRDNVVVQLVFRNGSIGSLTYAASGSSAFPKERLEVFVQGRTAVLDDFRRLELISSNGKRKMKSLFSTDKGHRAEWKAMVQAILDGGPSPIPLDEIVSTTLATFRAVDSINTGKPQSVTLVSVLRSHGASQAGSTVAQI